jgi:hypothetical protein
MIGITTPLNNGCVKPSVSSSMRWQWCIQSEQKVHGQTYRMWIYTTVQEKHVTWHPKMLQPPFRTRTDIWPSTKFAKDVTEHTGCSRTDNLFVKHKNM